MNYIVDLYKLILASVCAFIFGVLSVLMFLFKYWIIAVIFVLLFIVYLYIAFKNGSLIHVDGNHVYRVFPGGGTSLGWSEIQETGIVGLKVFGREGRKYTGTKYIYFSDHRLTEKELFDMCLKWPPKDMLYMRFSHKRIAAVQRYWAEEVTLYNTGNLHF